MSNFSFDPIPNGSAATPGLFNSRFEDVYRGGHYSVVSNLDASSYSARGDYTLGRLTTITTAGSVTFPSAASFGVMYVTNISGSNCTCWYPEDGSTMNAGDGAGSFTLANAKRWVLWSDGYGWWSVAP